MVYILPVSYMLTALVNPRVGSISTLYSVRTYSAHIIHTKYPIFKMFDLHMDHDIK